MTRNTPSAKTAFAAISLFTFAAIVAVLRVSFAGEVIVVTSTIQAAVDAANPGDTIIVPPGTYRESVLVAKDGIAIVGSPAAVIDASGFENGIRVGTGHLEHGDLVCPPITVRNFRLQGLTIQNAEENGVLLVGVDGFRLTGGTYLDNEEYGPFPVCSRNGLIDSNFASGHNDAAIYVGNDFNVVVEHNTVTRSAIGIEIENSSNAVVRHNLLRGNTTGVLVVVLPGLPFPFADDVLIERNGVIRNNFPNPVPVDSGDPVGLLPTGTGILNVGADRVVMRHNEVIGNDSVGVAIIQNPFAPLDPRIEPNPDGNEVRDNVILQNGQNPDPIRAQTPGADIVYDGTGVGNCFGNNVFKTQFPAGITAFFSCP